MPSTENSPLLSQPAPKVSFARFISSFWPLSLISFGGPQAHVALFYDRFVQKPITNPDPSIPRLEESTFLELYALAQSLPGPSSTQLATSIGATFGGAAGAFITFLIWHIPGFIVMTGAGLWFHSHLADTSSIALIQTLADHAIGLIAAAFSFVLVAVYKIVSKTCAGDNVKMAIALVSMFVSVTIPPAASSTVFIALLILGGLFYYLYFMYVARHNVDDQNVQVFEQWDSKVSPTTGIVLISVTLVVTIIISLLPSSNLGFRVLQIFWRIGLCVFGGGVVVVPMLLK